jgi:hypothetical protein
MKKRKETGRRLVNSSQDALTVEGAMDRGKDERKKVAEFKLGFGGGGGGRGRDWKQEER